MTTTEVHASPFASYLPAERAGAAQANLAAALAEVDTWQAAWESRGEEDEHYLKERLAGARAEVGNVRRYIKAGCPRVRGTA